MPTATLTSKGQVTIPLSLRTALGLHPGSQLDFIQENNGFRAIPVAAESTRKLKGRFSGRVAKPVSLEAMDEAIASEAVATLGLARKRAT
jgi:AbrB family looped-hinge helix DNA binding protein